MNAHLEDIREIIYSGVQSDIVNSKVIDQHEETKRTDTRIDLTLKNIDKVRVGKESHIGLRKDSNYKTEETMKGIYKRLIVYDLRKIGEVLDEIVDAFELSSLVILLDEWSSIRIECQPLLAEMIKMTLISGRERNIFLKFSCIPGRTCLGSLKSNHQSIGFLMGEELFEGIDLDKYYSSYIEPQENIVIFLMMILHKHLSKNIKQFRDAKFSEVFNYFKSNIFTDDGSMVELVNVSSGIPRDFLLIFTDVFLKSEQNLPISLLDIREAAYEFFHRRKMEQSISDEVTDLFERIYKYVSKKSYIFFVSNTYAKDPLLQEIYNNRWIHLIYQGITLYEGAERGNYDVYKIDPGRYINKSAFSKCESTYQTMNVFARTIKNMLHFGPTLDDAWTPKEIDPQIKVLISKWIRNLYATTSKVPVSDADEFRGNVTNILVDKIFNEKRSSTAN